MAKVMNPLMSSEARGKVGGTVYNTWRGIRYAKQNTSPAQPRSQRQLLIRGYMTRLTRLWGVLDAAERISWNDYSTAHPDIDWTGTSRRITGMNWFSRCGVRLLDMAQAVVHTAPIVAAPDPIVGLNFATGILQTVATWTPCAENFIMADFWCIGPHSAGVLAKIEAAKHKAYDDGNSGSYTVTGLSPGTYTFWVRMLSTVDGLASTWISDTVVITAA